MRQAIIAVLTFAAFICVASVPLSAKPPEFTQAETCKPTWYDDTAHMRHVVTCARGQ